MRSVRAFTGMVGVAALVALVPSARASVCQAPPGRSAIVEYCETVPSAKKTQRSHSPVPASTQRALEKAGPAGAAVLQLADSGTRKKRHARPVASRPPSAVSGLSFSLGRVGSVGSLLLWILVAVAVVLAVASLVRWRRRASAG
jgi:hypothetical protein